MNAAIGQQRLFYEGLAEAVQDDAEADDQVFRIAALNLLKGARDPVPLSPLPNS